MRTGDQLGREGAAGGTAARACCAPSTNGTGAMNGTGEGGLQVQSTTFHENFACGAGRPAFTSRRPPEYDWPDEWALHKRGLCECSDLRFARFSACGARAAGFYKPPAAGEWQDPAPVGPCASSYPPVCARAAQGVGRGGFQAAFESRFVKILPVAQGRPAFTSPPPPVGGLSKATST